MKKLTLNIALFFVSLTVFAQVADLKCEHLINPIGIDSSEPRLSWRFSNDVVDGKQSAYQIVINSDKASVWDSGKTNSDSRLISYAGKELQPFTQYTWKVRVWDENGKIYESPSATFETGMMNIGNWKGAWIGDGRSIDHKEAPYFRKTFDSSKAIKSARAYIAVAGLYELYINGEKIGNHRLDPLYSRFDRRNYYVTYDVTDNMKSGKNAIGVLLGNGWYNHQSIGVWNFHNAPWRNRPAFCFDLRITYTDGSVEIVSSERDWRTSSGSLIFNSIYTAEHYDNRLEQAGWNTSDFDDSKWHGVGYRGAPSQNVTAQQVVPIRNVDEIKPISFKQLDDSTYIYDLGRNISGVTKFKVKGEAGTTLKLKHTERLYENGYVDMSNIDVYHRPIDNTDPFQVDIYTLGGKGEEEFMPKFNYKGFRYVQVTTSQPIALDINNLTGYFMHSDVKAVGSIKSSNQIIDKIWWATNNAYLSNLMGYPTDCPQREKNGWTGDGHLAVETGLYNFDGITIYEKWLADHRDEQQPNGVLPDIIPTGGWGYGTDNGVDWTSTIAIIPWNIYLFYGDSKLLADCYDNIRRYVNYIDYHSPNGLTSWGRGDWVPVKSGSTKELMSSIYYYVDTKILADAAKLFNKQDDYRHYSALAEKIRNAINDKYLNKETGMYANGTQTEQSMPLMWNVVTDDMRQTVADNLAKKVEANGFHLDVGVHGAKALLYALSENGHAETAYKVSIQDKYPSWGWWVANGATTLLENWDLEAKRDISDNHMMFGAVGGWFFRGLGGIYPDEAQPGFKHIVLRPYFATGLNQFESKYESQYGEIVSKWDRKKKNITYTVTVPANTTATLYLPDMIKDAKTMELKAGTHVLNLKAK